MIKKIMMLAILMIFCLSVSATALSESEAIIQEQKKLAEIDKPGKYPVTIRYVDENGNVIENTIYVTITEDDIDKNKDKDKGEDDNDKGNNDNSSDDLSDKSDDESANKDDDLAVVNDNNNDDKNSAADETTFFEKSKSAADLVFFEFRTYLGISLLVVLVLAVLFIALQKQYRKADDLVRNVIGILFKK